jgi:hypothetical protein
MQCHMLLPTLVSCLTSNNNLPVKDASIHIIEIFKQRKRTRIYITSSELELPGDDEAVIIEKFYS